MMYGPSDVPFRVGTSSIGPHGTSGKGKGGKGDGKGKVNVSARANLYYYALDHGLLAETLEEQERQGTASGQDAPLHGLQPGRMSHGSSDEELVCDHCRREIREDQDSHPCPVQRCRYIIHRNCVRPHMQEHHHSSPIPPEFASPFPIKLKPMRGSVVDLDGKTQTVIGGKPELSDVATQTVIGLIPIRSSSTSTPRTRPSTYRDAKPNCFVNEGE